MEDVKRDVNDFDVIEMPCSDDFYREYMAELKPVVIKDMFKGEAIREIRNRNQAIEQLGQMKIDVQEEYINKFADNIKHKNQHVEANFKQKPSMALADYFSYVDAHREEKKMCMEFPAPEALANMYSVPKVCDSQEGESDYLMNQCFVGNQGNSARVHFDKGGTHGFLYQVFGKKRFIIFPHESANKLGTFTQFGAWAIDRMSAQERRDFLRFSGGKEVVLNAGECIYVPMLCWHYADYMEDSLSISLRFRRPNYVTQLANQLFPDQYYQGIAHKLKNQKNAKLHYAPLLADIDEAFKQSYSDGVVKVQTMRKLAKKVYLDLYTQDVSESRLLFDLESLLPPLLTSFLDSDDPMRPIYR